jgi:hypothetical protein
MCRTLCCVVVLLLVVGCTPDPRDIVDYSNEPIGMQLLRAEPMLKQRKFNTLLDFESPNDLVFVGTQPAATQERRHAHTGHVSCSIGSTATINLASVMLGRPFPADWTLAGAYLWSPHDATVEIDCVANGAQTSRTLTIAANKWTPAFVDLTQMKSTSAPGDSSLSFKSDQPILCDDVMVIDNSSWFVGGDTSPWTIRQRGFKINVDREGWFNITLDSIDGSENGWNIEDVSTMRATFSSPGKTKFLTMYSDGRTYWDGRYEALSGNAKSDAALAKEHQQPGKIMVAEGMGRANRNTPGDANNDGYNETLGAYELIATGPRMEMTFTAQGVEVVRPIIEISGLPNGKPLVTLEGRLIQSLTRLKNGNVLIEVPARIEQPITLNVRIE